MKSGLKDRNNPGLDLEARHADDVSMKSGLKDRNNEQLEGSTIPFLQSQ